MRPNAKTVSEFGWVRSQYRWSSSWKLQYKSFMCLSILENCKSTRTENKLRLRDRDFSLSNHIQEGSHHGRRYFYTVYSWEDKLFLFRKREEYWAFRKRDRSANVIIWMTFWLYFTSFYLWFVSKTIYLRISLP